MTPATTQTSSKSSGDNNCPAIVAGLRKMPDPIIDPATSMTAVVSVSVRRNPVGWANGIAREIAYLSSSFFVMSMTCVPVKDMASCPDMEMTVFISVLVFSSTLTPFSLSK